MENLVGDKRKAPGGAVGAPPKRARPSPRPSPKLKPAQASEQPEGEPLAGEAEESPEEEEHDEEVGGLPAMPRLENAAVQHAGVMRHSSDHSAHDDEFHVSGSQRGHMATKASKKTW